MIALSLIAWLCCHSPPTPVLQSGDFEGHWTTSFAMIEPPPLQVEIVSSDFRGGKFVNEDIIRIEKHGLRVLTVTVDGEVRTENGYTITDAAKDFWRELAKQYQLSQMCKSPKP